jgi:hypothetical protein
MRKGWVTRGRKGKERRSLGKKEEKEKEKEKGSQRNWGLAVPSFFFFLSTLEDIKEKIIGAQQEEKVKGRK